MKRELKVCLGLSILFVAILIIVNLSYDSISARNCSSKYVVMNRLTQALQDDLESQTNADMDSMIEEEMAQCSQQFTSEFLPDAVIFHPLVMEENTEQIANIKTERQSYLWNLYGPDQRLVGILEYQYRDRIETGNRILLNAIWMTCFFALLVFVEYVRIRIIGPIQEVTKYPEQLAKGASGERIAPTKNRYMKKLAWSFNLLADVLAGKEKKIRKMEYDRQTMLTSIAHGIKTPVANIRLYANAIETGLYQDGKVNEKDAGIAQKIERNALDIENLVSDMLTTTATSFCDYEPKIKQFYLEELTDQLEKSFGNRLKMMKIPYQFSCNGNPLMSSDPEGLITILSQLLENAMKYGNGVGITVLLEKMEDGYYLSVKNHGQLVPEREIPFLFKSFWRGSNSEDKEGSGIGLYVAKEMTRRLGGDLYVKRNEETSEMEFVVFAENIRG